MKTYIKTPVRREQLLAIACGLAESTHYRRVSRGKLAERAGTSTGNVSRVFGSMNQMRSDLIEYAIKHKVLTVVLQAIIDKHPNVENLDKDIRAAAVGSML